MLSFDENLIIGFRTLMTFEDEQGGQKIGKSSTEVLIDKQISLTNLFEFRKRTTPRTSASGRSESLTSERSRHDDVMGIAAWKKICNVTI